MKKTVSKLLALALASSLVLSGCGSSNNASTNTGDTTAAPTQAQGGATTAAGDTQAQTSQPAGNEGEPIKDLVLGIIATRELETFNILHSQRAEDYENLTNLTDGLLEVNNYGEVVPCIAEEWGSEDGGLTWTFKIRDGVKWVDVNGNEKADCTAQDFATGLEFVLNYHKNGSSNTSMPMELIKGASEYYEYTKGLSEEEGKALDTTKFFEMVGVEVPDASTIIYTCVAQKPYFDSVATYACLYPASQALIDELGVDGFLAMDNENMWYNGAYTLTSYIQGNEKVFTKNPMYWDTECTRFDTVTYKMVESADVNYQLYQSGEVDSVSLSESNLKTIYENEGHEFHDYLVEARPGKYSYQLQLNYDKRFDDGSQDTNWNTAIANKAFRLAWYYGLDLTEYYKRTNNIHPLKCENNFFTMKGLCYMSDGRDYVDVVAEKIGLGEYNGETMVRHDAAKGEQYKKQAMEELSAKGVTFPVSADYYISGSSQTALDSATVLKNAFSNYLGDDFVVLNIKTYVSSLAKEVRDPQLQAFTINGWGADYGDPQNYLSQLTYDNDNAYYSVHYNNINHMENPDPEVKALFQEFTKMVDAANAINDDMDKRYEAFAEAEAFVLQNALVIPCNYNPSWKLTHVNDYSKMNAMFGCQNDKMKNWQTSVDAYTTEQYQVFEQQFAEGKTK